MTTFSQIYDNALGYRNDFQKLNKLVLELANEKSKGDPLVSWFRLRNRRVVQVLDPMKRELDDRIKKEATRAEELQSGLEAVKKARINVQNNQLSNAQKILSEQVENVLDEKITLRNPDEAMDRLASLENTLKKERTKSNNDAGYYKMVSKNVDSAKELFTSTRRTKDMDLEAFSAAISSINHQKNTLDIDVPDLKELPDTYDKNYIADLHLKIRAVVAQIDSRYPMKLFADAVRTNRIIIHDVGNDRGKRAFTNRSEELVRYTNEAIEKFNNKYWQITGQRWERVGTNRHGYRSVKATHSRISKI